MLRRGKASLRWGSYGGAKEVKFSLKKLLLLIVFLFLFPIAAFAYSGNHVLNDLYTTTGNGHIYRSNYQSNGTFPFNLGKYDGAKVNLRGTFTITEADGNTQFQQYCVVTSGTLNRKGVGKLTAYVYSDPVTCSQYLETKIFNVKSYREDTAGYFSMRAVDEDGINSTTTGVHSF